MNISVNSATIGSEGYESTSLFNHLKLRGQPGNDATRHRRDIRDICDFRHLDISYTKDVDSVRVLGQSLLQQSGMSCIPVII